MFRSSSAPQQVRDPGLNTYRLVYDPQSRVDSLVVAASGGAVGVRERRTYDLDGRMVTRQRVSTNAGIGQLNLDSLTYDHRGKVIKATTDSRVQAPESVSYVYDVHGAVVAQERSRGAGSYHVEEFRNDAYGNAFFSRTRSSTGANDAPSVAFFNPDGALYDRHTVLPGTVQQNHREEMLTQGAAPAALETTSRLVAIPPINGGGAASQLASKQYYSADQRLMVVQRYDYLVGSDTDVGTWEEYRYDALGRRVLMRARRDFLNTPDSSRALCNDPVGGSCGSYIQRSLWDGDQLLYEWRVPEAAPTGMTSGSAGYVHLEGIDQPIGLIRPEGTRVINYTWRGLGESSVFTNGASGDCAIPFSNCTPVQWPGKTQAGVYFTPNLLASGPSGPYTWFGTLAENGGGSTGMLFRRNRYFDPVSGRFTQQDPIGVAGGLNLYGFADGDPVNFADPFGLYPCCVGANAIVLGFAGTLKERRAEILTGLSKDDMVGVALSSTPAGAGARIGGQLHHVVSKAIGRAMSNAPRLRGALGEMRQRLVTRARDLMSHRGYQKWHRDLDKEVIEFIEQNPGVSPSRFERFLEERYAKPDLADKFPGGTRNP